MKTLMVIISLLVAASSQAAIVQCAGKIAGKTETFQARINEQNRLVWFAKDKLVQTTRGSYFAWLSDMDNFGLEGHSSFIGKNGYSALSVTNTAETVTIGLSPNLKLGYYSYRDGGSGAGHAQVALVCRVLPKEFPI